MPCSIFNTSSTMATNPLFTDSNPTSSAPAVPGNPTPHDGEPAHVPAHAPPSHHAKTTHPASHAAAHPSPHQPNARHPQHHAAADRHNSQQNSHQNYKSDPPEAAPKTTPSNNEASTNAAIDLIRAKLNRLYADEPDAQAEAAEAASLSNSPHRSRHQQFMYDLSTSGKSLAQVQTEWHYYYSTLPDDEKHAVWQEFYSHSNRTGGQPANSSGLTDSQENPPDKQTSGQSASAHTARQLPPAQHHPSPVPAGIYPVPAAEHMPASGYRQPATSSAEPPANTMAAGDLQPTANAETAPSFDDSREPAAIKQQLRESVAQRTKLKPRHHIQSLLFGLGCGGLALLVVLFSFFNEVVIAPFIQPSRTVSATPIIIGADGIAPTDKAEVIIPKINVQIPLDFSAKTIREDDIQKGLENGVAHYPTTPLPGQQGNTAFFGHSSNNIFNPGKYKFAFVLLREMVPGDTFYLTRNGVAYAYQVFDKKVIDPSEVGILAPIPGKTATATLITCDPPGTTLKRLAIIGEQVSPNPTANTADTPPPATANTDDQSLPGNPPSLWHRMTSWL